MALIDITYFHSNINIPNTDKPEVYSNLNELIPRIEKELLINLLGYAMYKVFIDAVVFFNAAQLQYEEDYASFEEAYAEYEQNGGEEPIPPIQPVLEQRWAELLNGVAYTYNNKEYYWKGLRNVSEKTSLIADYIYFYYVRNTTTITTGIGEEIPNTENGSRSNNMNKSVAAWNNMVDCGCELYQFLRSERDTYIEWQNNYWSNLNKINLLNI